MDLQTIRLFSQYNETTNKTMNKIISGLSTDQWEKEFKGYFNSVKSMCNHIYICDFNWLKRFSILREFNYIKKSLFSDNIGFKKMVIGKIPEYIEKRNELDNEINNFVNEITSDDLKEKFKYTDSHGKEYSRNFGGAILHMFNHGTHHRGMVSIYLEELGVENDYSNLISLV